MEYEDPAAELDYVDDLSSEGDHHTEATGVAAPVSRKRKRKEKKKEKKLVCPTCSQSVEHVKRHVIRFHLPWFWVPDHVCWQCKFKFVTQGQLQSHLKRSGHREPFGEPQFQRWTRLVHGTLIMACQDLRLAGLSALVRHMQATPSLQPTFPVELTVVEKDLLRRFSATLALPCPEEIDIQRVNCTAALWHWRIIGRVLSQLQPSQRSDLWGSELTVSGAGFPCDVAGVTLASDTAGRVESHFHLDKLLQRSREPTLRQLEATVTHVPQISTFIAVYCFPSSWPAPNQHAFHARDDRLRFAYGIHPRQASAATTAAVGRLPELLRRPGVVALGEVGLDYAKDPQKDASARDEQHKLLDQLLPLAADSNMPVVIHCRDRGSGSAASDCCKILQRHLPPDHQIHLHCYSYGLQEMLMWTKSFYNLSFGFTATLLYPD